MIASRGICCECQEAHGIRFAGLPENEEPFFENVEDDPRAYRMVDHTPSFMSVPCSGMNSWPQSLVATEDSKKVGK